MCEITGISAVESTKEMTSINKQERILFFLLRGRVILCSLITWPSLLGKLEVDDLIVCVSVRRMGALLLAPEMGGLNQDMQ